MTFPKEVPNQSYAILDVAKHSYSQVISKCFVNQCIRIIQKMQFICEQDCYVMVLWCTSVLVAFHILVLFIYFDSIY